MYPATCTDERLNAALLRAIDGRGQFIGTAFSVLGDGTCITCDHVLRASQTLKFINAQGEQLSKFDQIPAPGLSGSDIALIRLATGGSPFPKPLPILDRPNATAFRMRTWVDERTGVVGSLPITGGLTGPTKITYSRHGRDYIAQDVFTLSGPAIRPGMSGTPLIDPTVDAVVAIVVANFGGGDITAGFGLPISILAADADSRKICELNDGEVQRFGLQPNHSAVAELAEVSNHAVLMPGRAGRLFDPDRFVARESFIETVSDFMKSPETTLAVFGAVGTGKTTALASLTQKIADPLCFFIRAIDISDVTSTIDTLLRDRIAKAFEDSPNSIPTLAALATAVAGSNSHLVVLVDGLNEPHVDRVALVDQWLPQTIDALAAVDAKLIFTARNEFKDLVLSRDYAQDFFDVPANTAKKLQKEPDREPRSSGPREKAVFVGFYTSREFEKARIAYGFAQEPEDPELRHPLTLRLAAETGLRASDRRGTRYGSRRVEAFDRLFDRIVQRVLERSGLSHKAYVIAFCEELAQEAAQSSSQQLPVSNTLDEPTERLFSALLRENVIEATPTGFRFFLDALLDYLISRRLDLLSEIARAIKTGSTKAVNFDAVALAVARRIAQNDLGEVSKTLHLLVDALPKQQPPFDRKEHRPSYAPFEIVELVDWMIVSTPPLPALSQVKQEYLSNRLPVHLADPDFSIDFLDRAVWAFDPEQLTTLIRELMLETEGYGWRYKDVSDPYRRSVTRSYGRGLHGVFRLVSRLFESMPQVGLRILVNLLGEEEPLSHDNRRGASNEATVGSISACLIYAHFGELSVEQIWRELVGSATPYSVALVSALAQEFPAETLQQIEWHLAAKKPGVDVNVLHALAAILNSPSSVDYIARVGVVVTALAERPGEEEERVFWLVANRAFGLPDGLAVNLAMRFYGRTGSLSLIVECVIEQWISVDHGLTCAVSNGRVPPLVFWRELLERLGFRQSPPPDLVRQTLTVLRDELPSVGRDEAFARDLETFLYKFDLATATDIGLLDLVAECIDSRDPTVSHNFAFFAIPATDRPDRIALTLRVQELLAVEPVPDGLREFMISRFLDGPPAAESERIVLSLLAPLPFAKAAKLIITAGLSLSSDLETRLWMLRTYRRVLSMTDQVRLDRIIERIESDTRYPASRDARYRIVKEFLEPNSQDRE